MPRLRGENDDRGFFHHRYAALGEDLAFSLENFQLPKFMLMEAKYAGFVHCSGLEKQDFAGWLCIAVRVHCAKILKANCYGKTVLKIAMVSNMTKIEILGAGEPGNSFSSLGLERLLN